MPKLSACVISFNEEKKIADCLRSLQAVADEIIVVDSLSTDRTREIAAEFTDKIFEQKFLGHIEQKNLAVSRASHDWILSLDCDERLDERLIESIRAIKDRLDEHDAYRMARKTFYVYRWLNHCWYPDMKVRLFNRNTAHWGGTNPHDHVEVDGSDIVTLNGDIQHYSFDSISDHIRTLDNFTEIGAREIIRKGKRVGLLSPFTHGAWTFLKVYVIKQGFRDGFAGVVVSMLSGMHAFVKYAKVIFHRRKERSET
ncbi:MAG TPA: glycosyltransferase family 2 protein [Gammaproteobacteria bacterium]|nr:glycosyltransferase family 2 protein [Gammaproteobacteria bacterium]